MLDIQALDLTAAQASKPVALTIGTFDGVHVGHQSVLLHAKELAQAENGSCAAVTFSEHPSQILRPENPVKALCTLQHKTSLIEKSGIDRLLLLKFSPELASLSAEAFILQVRSFFSFSHLVLGYDASFGKNREGSCAVIKRMADDMRFSVIYLPAVTCEGMPVSSSRIRAALERGELDLAHKLLGRRYSIYAQVIKGSQNGRAIGFPTANVDVEGLSLPPYGVYAVYLLFAGQRYPAIANLGVAPTIKRATTPVLEVHVFAGDMDLYGQNIEVEFLSFLRPEHKFESLAQLQQQIHQDIRTAKELLSVR